MGENYKNNKNTVQNNWNTNSVFITKCLIWGNNFKRYIDLCEAPTLFSEKSLWACTVDNQKWKQNQINPYCYFQQINEQLSTSEGLYCMLSGKLLFQGSQEILPQSNHDSSTQPLCTLHQGHRENNIIRVFASCKYMYTLWNVLSFCVKRINLTEFEAIVHPKIKFCFYLPSCHFKPVYSLEHRRKCIWGQK